MKPKCYIAGGIGHPPKGDYKERFAQGKIEVEVLGYTPVSPLDLPHQHDGEWSSYMREDITALLSCSHVYALRNWQQSRGATLEIELARQLGIEIIEQL